MGTEALDHRPELAAGCHPGEDRLAEAELAATRDPRPGPAGEGELEQFLRPAEGVSRGVGQVERQPGIIFTLPRLLPT